MGLHDVFMATGRNFTHSEASFRVATILANLLDYVYKIFLLTSVAKSEFAKHNCEVKNKVVLIF